MLDDEPGMQKRLAIMLEKRKGRTHGGENPHRR
jgi:hypothetical protein